MKNRFLMNPKSEIWNCWIVFFFSEYRRYYTRIEGLMNEPFSKRLFYFCQVLRQLQIYSLTAMQFGDVSFFFYLEIFIVVSMQICFYKLWLFLMSTSVCCLFVLSLSSYRPKTRTLCAIKSFQIMVNHISLVNRFICTKITIFCTIIFLYWTKWRFY